MVIRIYLFILRIDKNCKVCGTPFVGIKTTQYFCSRKCFKKDYNTRKREERKHDRETNPARYGFYYCTHCNDKTPLPYSPKRYKTKFETYECPTCGVPRFKDPVNMRDDWEWDQIHWSSGWREPTPGVRNITITVTTLTVTSTK